MSRFLVFRLPCTQEDEGRKTFLGEEATYEDAERFRDAERRGYYFSSDFEIMEVI